MDTESDAERRKRKKKMQERIMDRMKRNREVEEQYKRNK